MGGYTEVEENGRSKGTSLDSVEAWSPGEAGGDPLHCHLPSMLGTRYLHTATGGVGGAEVLVCGGTGEDARTCEVLTPGGWQMLGLTLQWRSGHVAWRHTSSNYTYLLGGEGKQNNADIIDSDHSLMSGSSRMTSDARLSFNHVTF